MSMNDEVFKANLERGFETSWFSDTPIIEDGILYNKVHLHIARNGEVKSVLFRLEEIGPAEEIFAKVKELQNV